MAGWDRSFFSETVGTSFERARMLFNSFDFIFLFLPVTLAAFDAAVRLHSSSVAVLVLLVASYLLDHFAVLLLAGSTAFNYVIGQAIAWSMRRGEGTLGRLLLGIGNCGDLALLGNFKYAGFLPRILIT
jgi:alginate O-acetyltransferase complex protein AlgI